MELTRKHPARALLSALVVVAVALVPLAAEVATAPSASAAPPPSVAHGRHARMGVDLVSRSYSGGAWTIVVDATLSSNNICLPLVFDCIVGSLPTPAGTQLVDLQCRSQFWNHLMVFRDHCLKQFFTAGHHQRFRLTYRTTQQSGTLQLGVEFGRGVLPFIFQQLAQAVLTVDLDDALDVSKTCDDPDGIYDPGAPIVCTVVVDYPTPASGPGAPITAATVADVADPAVFATGALAFTSTTDPGLQTWSCPSTCSLATGSISSGTSTTFTYTGVAVSTPTGAGGSNDVTLDWTSPSSGSATSGVDLTVEGTGDTDLTITKASTGATVTVGQPLSWTVTVSNPGNGAGLAADAVTVTDLATLQVAGVSSPLTGITLSYTSGVGTWTCTGAFCTAASMPVGSTTFTATTVATVAGTIANEAGVAWANDILGPDGAQVAGAVATAEAPATTTTTVPPTSVPSGSGAVPARLSFTG